MLKKRIFLWLFILATTSLSNSVANQDRPQINKGQLIQAPQIFRSTKILSLQKANTQTLFQDDFESGDGQWTINGYWVIGNPSSGPLSGYNSTNCAATNLHGDYNDNARDWLQTTSINLPTISGPDSYLRLYFWEWFQTESGYDYGQVQILSNSGSSWTTLDTRDGSSDWRETMIDLSSYADQTIQIRFYFMSDGSRTYDGWYIDDVRVVLEEPEPLGATMVSLNHQKFPFIYMNVAVDTFSIGFPDLTQNNFTVYENGIEQTDYFEVQPPESGGGSRLADIIFVLDVTSSMEEEINAVKQNMLNFVTALRESGIDYNVGFVVFGDIVFTYNSGNLYNEQSEILSIINNISLKEHGIGSGGDGPENQFGAMVEAATSINYRPGAQRIEILLTDAPSHYADGVTPYTTESTIQKLNAANITVFPVFDNYESNQLTQYVPIAEETNSDGVYYHIYDNFNDIITHIGSSIAATYLIRYKSSNPIADGTTRHVHIEVRRSSDEAECDGVYLPGSMPVITRTVETIELENRAWADGTAFTIEAKIVDTASPFVENAILYYKNSLQSAYRSTSMNYIGGDMWRGVIYGSYVQSPGVDYYITASDGENTVSSPSVNAIGEPYQIAILPNVAPSITHTPVTTLIPGALITISATILDGTNTLMGAKLYYRKTGQLIYENVDMAKISDSYGGSIPGSFVSNDGVDYYIRAWDDFGVNGYSGTADAPHQIEPDYDLGFRPNPDGWSFSNSAGIDFTVNPPDMTNAIMWPRDWWQNFDYSGYPYPLAWRWTCEPQDFPNWELFVETFGEEHCYWEPPPGTVIYSPTATLKWFSIKGNWEGSCFGFAISSLLFFDGYLTLSTIFPSHEKVFDVPINDNSRRLINKYQLYQYGKEQLEHEENVKNYTPQQTLNVLKGSFRNKKDNITLLLKNYVVEKGKEKIDGGHAVVPYKIEINPNNSDEYFVYVYDNNRPDSDATKVVIDQSTNSWSYEPLRWGYHRKGILPSASIRNYQTSPILAKQAMDQEMFDEIFLEVYTSTSNDILLKNLRGGTIGFIDGELFENIEKGHPIITFSPTLSNARPQGYYIPQEEYSIMMQNFEDAECHFSAFADSLAISYSRSDADSTQTDYLTYGDSFSIGNPDDQKKAANIECIAISDPDEKAFELNNYSLSQNDSIVVKIVNRENLNISNLNSTSRYDVKITLAAENTFKVFEHQNIIISENCSHQIQPEWRYLGEKKVMILIDRNMNGSIDDTLYVENQYVGDTPPTGGRLDNNNIYFYPNPFNPDTEIGTIRYSLKEPGTVTIKIYDAANTLVKTLIEDEPREAGVESAESWNGKNEEWDIVANGVYFYVIESSSGEQAVGKIAVLR